MRIPKFEDKNYLVCSECSRNECIYISKKCLHKLCDTCYKNKFKILGSKYLCAFCQKDNEPLELFQEDFSKESPFQIHYNEILKRREKIYKLVYKRRENFTSNEDYNKYLEDIEKYIQKNNNEKEIEKIYFQNENEKEENDEKRKKELEEIHRKLKENSPMHYNSSKFCFDFEGNEINPEELKVESNPIIYEAKITQEEIKYIPNIEKEKKTGGYNINKIYEFLAKYSRAGFINKKN